MTPELMTPTPTACPELDALLEAVRPFITYVERTVPPEALAGMHVLIQFVPTLLRVSAGGKTFIHCTRFSQRLLEASANFAVAGLNRLAVTDRERVSRMLNADAAGVVLALDPVLGCGQGLLSDGIGKSEIIFHAGNQVH
jgi:hypothetical protein